MQSATTGTTEGPMLVVVHPGSPRASRMSWLDVPLATRRSVTLAAGEDIFTAIHLLLDSEKADGAAFTLVAGSLALLALMTGGPGTITPMTFHGPHRITSPVTIVRGAGITGLDEGGSRISHCHAAFVDGDNRAVGGHLISGEAIVGPGGAILDVTLLYGAVFVRRADIETGFDIFYPEPL